MTLLLILLAVACALCLVAVMGTPEIYAEYDCHTDIDPFTGRPR